jgi:hypothetical protein
LRTPHDFAVALKSIRSLFWLWTRSDIFKKRKNGTSA